MLYLFTDGSKTKRRSGWAFLLMNDKYEELCEGYGYAGANETNNRQELRALIMGLRACTAHKKHKITWVSDSKYAIGSMTGNTAKKNHDLINTLYDLYHSYDIVPLHIRSHRPRPQSGKLAQFLWDGNDYVDNLCT